MLLKSFAHTAWANCFHNDNSISDSCFQHSLSAALPQSQSATNTFSYALIWEVRCIKWLHFHMAITDTEIFSDILFSSTEALCNQTLEPEAKGGGGDSKQLQFPVISALAESRYRQEMMCVSIWPKIHLQWPHQETPTVRQGVEMGGGQRWIKRAIFYFDLEVPLRW